MKKYPIGFNVKPTSEVETKTTVTQYAEVVQPKKSVVHIYFPHRGMGWSYYNDSFDLKVGDFVYVEGQLEGYRGQVTEVNYSFKIKLSDYKKVIAVVDTNVKGDFFLAGSHIVSFDKNALPFSKILTWFKAPENSDDYISSNDDDFKFPLDELSRMNISNKTADLGHDYYLGDRVVYLELDKNQGRAIIEGSKNYEIEFEYQNREISNIKCSCFCSGACKHQFAAMLQLRETLDLISENYQNEFNNYFAIISKNEFMNTVMNKKVSGKISLGV